MITPSFTVETFKTFLEHELQLKNGDTLFVHSSVFKLNINFPAHEIINILEKIVGEEGTLVFPCWHFNYRAEDYLKNPEVIFDIKKSPTVMGLLPELVRRNKKAIRSLHPINSVVAIGKHAEFFVKDHHLSIYPNDENSPFYRITKFNGKIVGVGEHPKHSFSFVHCIEDIQKSAFPIQTRTDHIYSGKVIDYQGNETSVDVKPPHQNIQNRNVSKYLKKYIKCDECLIIRKKSTWFYVADSKLMYQKMLDLSVKGITIYNP